MPAFDFRSIMSGRRKDPSAFFMRGLLRGASVFYGFAARFRNRGYDRDRGRITHCSVPVISVGNITTGGTGKTPVVRFLAHWFRRRGLRVAIISRGYGRGTRDLNDEAMELHSLLPDVPHVQDPDRVEAARIAIEELDTELILMDDGFQHRRLARDLDLVVVDATCPFGYGYLLPRGLLRESLDSLQRADLILLSRCSDVSEQDLVTIEGALEKWAAGVPRVRCDHRPVSLLIHPDERRSLSELQGSSVAAVSAIGNPLAFHETIKRAGVQLISTRALPDHDAYEPETVAELDRWIRLQGDRIQQVVCTHKDLVKLQTDRLGGLPLAAVCIELAVVAGEQQLEEVLRTFVSEQ